MKEDWWYKFNGRTISPRPELLKEFSEEAKQKILIYNADSFLTYSKSQIGTDIDDKILEEIKNLRLKDEDALYNKSLNTFINSFNKSFDKSINQEIYNHTLKDKLNNSEYSELYKSLLGNIFSENFENSNRRYTNLEKENIIKHLLNSKRLDKEERIILYNMLNKYFDNSKNKDDDGLEFAL